MPAPVPPDVWASLEPLLDAALDLEPERRAEFLAHACADDPARRGELERMLLECERAASRVDRPAAQRFVSLLLDPEPSAPLPPTLAERFLIERELGRGGSATVYLAHDLKHDRRVAVKVLHPRLTPILGAERFLAEVRLTAALRHPHILPLLDSGEAAGHLYYVTPYVEGESLRERLTRAGPLPVDEALGILRDVADALTHAHRRGVVHRDVKPENILLGDGGAIVADFGIARAATDEPGQTPEGILVGTPPYMSPERWTGGVADARSDVYALGCVLFEMLVGEPPFAGRGVEAVLTRHLMETPPPLRSRRADAPAAVERAVARALAKSPEARFAAAVDLAAAAAGAGPQAAPRAALGVRPWRVALAAALGAAVIASGAYTARGLGGEPLDPSRVLLVPLRSRAPALGPEAGESVVTLLGYALEGAGPLERFDATDYARGADSTPSAWRALSRRVGAATYVDGSIEPAGDSVTVILRLHDVATDRVLVRGGATGAAPALPQLALAALRPLLPKLVRARGRVDLAALADRAPAAITRFLDGDGAYARTQFDSAIALYREALGHDDRLAVAALKGAQAASWINAHEEASALADAALAHAALLPTRYAELARALREYLDGDADGAIARLRPLLAQDPRWTDAWFLLGEVYEHHLPSRPRADSLELMADSAFRTAVRIDPEFVPALWHLHDHAIRRDRLARADSLARRVEALHPDAPYRAWEAAMVRCARSGPTAVDWAHLRRVDAIAGWSWGPALARGVIHGACARAAFHTTLTAPAADVAARWGALLGEHGLLLAAGRDRDVVTLVRSRAADSLPGAFLLLTAAEAGASVAAEAAEAAASLGERYDTLSATRLWALTQWESRLGRADRLRRIRAALVAKRDSTHARRDSLFVRVADARLALATGDTASAERQLRALAPRAPLPDIEWRQWDGLGAERLLLARVLFAGGRYAEAAAQAAVLDGGPITYLAYVRPALELRARAAEALGDRATAGRARARLRWLASDTVRLGTTVRLGMS